MRKTLRRMIPSMFHRRLLLLALAVLCAGGLLGTQLLRLTVVHGHTHRAQAESVLKQRTLIPTARGRILDRQLRVLAVDEPSYDLAVHWSVITGVWADQLAEQDARLQHAEVWRDLSSGARAHLIEQCREPHDQAVQNLWDTLGAISGISRPELMRQLADIKAQVQSAASAHWTRQLQRRIEVFDENVSLADVARPLREHVSYHPVLHDVGDSARLQVAQAIAGAVDDKRSIWRQVQIVDAKARRYPLETLTVELDRSGLPGPLKNPEPLQLTVPGVATHLLGAMRPAYREDVEQRPFHRDGGYDLGGYRAGDMVGSWGVEKAQEGSLRGRLGQKVLDRETHQVTRLEPVPGQDVVITLDVLLQARIQALMSQDPRIGLMMRQPWHAKEQTGPLGEPLNGAAVVLDIEQGQILAAVSVPGMSLTQLRDEPDSVLKDHVNKPYLNRPIAAQYQPGSTLKPLVLAAALAEGRVRHDEHIECTGYLIPPGNPNSFRCWIYKNGLITHEPLAGPEALRRSCNIYFFTLGRRLGSTRMITWLDRFGLGSPTGCGLEEEAGGSIPDLSRADDPNASGFQANDATFMGIGQGPVAWTPLQAANAYAAIARGGHMLPPTILVSHERPRTPMNLKLSRAIIDDVLQGLWEGVNERGGTSRSIPLLEGESTFNLPGVRVYGKSGTADPGVTRIDGKLVEKPGDHAWFAGLVQREGAKRPSFVIVVVVEHAGSGGAVSGPIANQILYAMRAEGYL